MEMKFQFQPDMYSLLIIYSRGLRSWHYFMKEHFMLWGRVDGVGLNAQAVYSNYKDR